MQGIVCRLSAAVGFSRIVKVASRGILPLAVVFALGFHTAPATADGVPFQKGDVLVEMNIGSGYTWDNQIKHFSPNGALLDKLDFGYSNNFLWGLGFDASSNLYAALNNTINNVYRFNANGNRIGTFGGGYEFPTDIAFDKAGNVFVGEDDVQALTSGKILKFDHNGVLLATFVAQGDPTSGFGVEYMALAPDQCTMRYGSQGEAIKQFDVCKNLQLPDLVSSLPDPLKPAVFSIRQLPDGDLLVGSDDGIFVLDSSGGLVSKFTNVELPLYLDLDPDGKTFWVVDDYHLNVYHLDIQDGAVLAQFSAYDPNVSEGIDYLIVVPTPQVADKIDISASSPIIPTSSRLSGGKILTRSTLTLKVTDNSQPVPNVTPILRSDRGSDDTITGPVAPTDTAGVATASVETRTQPGTSTITSNSPDITTSSPGVIAWLPARYESAFLVTCYVISNEGDFLNTPLTSNVNGLPPTNQYRSGFISDVRLQGSGEALDGTVVHYAGRGRYSTESCALTASGACASDGVTVAVDKSVVPLRGSISIDGDGARTAQDTGGAIVGYHIDEYYGSRRAACLNAGRRTLGVHFSSY